MSDIKPKDIVRHKKDKTLVRGEVTKISKSGKSADVYWRYEDNPQLANDHWWYYRIDLLEKVEG
jgi:hypothetical protein